MPHRLFLAIALPESYTDQLTRITRRYQLPGLKWVPPQNWHITVLFLGKVDERLLPDILERVRIVCDQTQPFVLEFEQLVLAPPHRAKTMVWLQLRSDKQFEQFAVGIYTVLKSILPGLAQPHSDKLTPHITLARLAGHRLVPGFKNPDLFKNGVFNQPDLPPLRVTTGTLFKSQLNPDHAEYTPLANFNLKSVIIKS